jgi:acyl-CoA thioesterase YciA
MEQKPDTRLIAQRTTMLPADINGRGKIFGGHILRLMDLAGAYTAHRVCKNRFIKDMVTRATSGVEFKKPVEVNDTVTFYGKVIKVGTTSCTVQVDVEADRFGEIIPVLSGTMTFVALDAEGKPTPIRTGNCEIVIDEPAADAQPAQDQPASDNTSVSKCSKCKCGKKKNKKNKRCKKHKKHKKNKK